jgi:hypothetical protein
MDTVTIKLTHKQLSALQTFLERSEIRGWEIPMFLDIAKAVANPEKENQDA